MVSSMKEWSIWLRERWLLGAGAASVAILGAAHAFEAAGYEPCALCYTQRHVYWGAIAIAAVGVAGQILVKRPLLTRLSAALLGVTFLAGFGIAAYHAGVEWKLWPGPATCTNTGGGPMSPDDILSGLGKKRIVVPCDEAAWRDPVLGLSMAAWNAALSAALAGFSILAAAAPLPAPKEE
jgi:disulfide bond formation protein DsbB